MYGTMNIKFISRLYVKKYVLIHVHLLVLSVKLADGLSLFFLLLGVTLRD
jgi:hypothetical protein